MAPPKQKPSSKKPVKPMPRRKPIDSPLQRSARDPFAGPSSSKQIERSLEKGTRKTLAEFRGDIDWE